jgi:hypothetical protein
MEKIKLGGKEVTLQQAVDQLIATTSTLQTQNGNLQAELRNQTQANNTEVMALRNQLEALRTGQQGGRAPLNMSLINTIGKFSGKSKENIKFYFSKIERAAELAGWGDEQKLAVARQLLEGDALEWAHSDDDASAAGTYAEFEALAIARYKSKSTARYHRELLTYMKIKSDEDIEEFADRIRATNSHTYTLGADKSKNEATKFEADQRALDTFLNGLEGEVGERTRDSRPQTFSAAVTSAINYQESTRRGVPEQSRTPRAVFAVSVTCYRCGKVGHTRRECPEGAGAARGAGRGFGRGRSRQSFRGRGYGQYQQQPQCQQYQQQPQYPQQQQYQQYQQQQHAPGGGRASRGRGRRHQGGFNRRGGGQATGYYEGPPQPVNQGYQGNANRALPPTGSGPTGSSQ